MCPVLFGATVSATDVYVRGLDGWDCKDAWKMTTTDNNIYTLAYRDYESTGEEKDFKFGSDDWGTEYPNGMSNLKVTIPSGTYDLYFYLNLSGNTYNVYYLNTSKQVELRGDWGDWNTTPLTLTSSDAFTFTGTLDLSTKLSDQKFKLVLDGSDWKGYGDGNLSVIGNDLISDATDGSYNLILLNSTLEYKTYSVKAVWTPSASTATGWTLTIAGDEARAHQDYTLSFINNSAWTDVACYVWDDSNVPQVAWPGIQMTTKDGTVTIGDNTYDKYTQTFTFYEPYPTKVIFNNNVSVGALQTGDLTLIEGETYSMPVYYICGKAAAFGNWNSSLTTAIMTDDGDGTYSYAQNDVVLGKDFAFKVVKKSYYGSNDPTWYPYNNQTLSVPVDGKYNVVISFDGSKDMNTSETIEGSSATKTYEAVTIGATGWATTVTNSPLNFADLTESFKAYTASLDGTTVSLNEVANVQAETGLVLKGTEGTYYAPVIAESSTDKGSLGFSSIYSYDVTTSNNCYGLRVSDGKAKFAKVKVGETIPAQKAFFITDPGLGAQEFTVIFDETTGVNLNVISNLDSNAILYNLAGQKVSKSYKGIVISNGKKYINK